MLVLCVGSTATFRWGTAGVVSGPSARAREIASLPRPSPPEHNRGLLREDRCARVLLLARCRRARWFERWSWPALGGDSVPAMMATPPMGVRVTPIAKGRESAWRVPAPIPRPIRRAGKRARSLRPMLRPTCRSRRPTWRGVPTLAQTLESTVHPTQRSTWVMRRATTRCRRAMGRVSRPTPPLMAPPTRVDLMRGVLTARRMDLTRCPVTPHPLTQPRTRARLMARGTPTRGLMRCRRGDPATGRASPSLSALEVRCVRASVPMSTTTSFSHA